MKAPWPGVSDCVKYLYAVSSPMLTLVCGARRRVVRGIPAPVPREIWGSPSNNAGSGSPPTPVRRSLPAATSEASAKKLQVILKSGSALQGYGYTLRLYGLSVYV